ncbi:MAG: hypothetical protein KC636_39575, partial [Myxococcales bacterium]|nr:hypothetical protein [Myxococcales bacterium]
MNSLRSALYEALLKCTPSEFGAVLVHLGLHKSPQIAHATAPIASRVDSLFTLLDEDRGELWLLLDAIYRASARALTDELRDLATLRAQLQVRLQRLSLDPREQAAIARGFAITPLDARTLHSLPKARARARALVDLFRAALAQAEEDEAVAAIDRVRERLAADTTTNEPKPEP